MGGGDVGTLFGSSAMLGRRLSICYLAPDHDLVASSGATRNVLSVARELAKWANVTVAFGRVLEPLAPTTFKIAEIDPKADRQAERARGPRALARQVRAVRRFTDERLIEYDVVLEHSWALTGAVTAWCARRGVPSVPLLDAVPPRETSLAGRMAGWVARSLSGRYLRRAKVLATESDALKRAVVGGSNVAAERIEIVTLGVDDKLFYPGAHDVELVRHRLGLAPTDTAMLYVGSLDHAHDLEPVIEAVARAGDPSLRLHIVGDGPMRPHLERAAGGAKGIRFHGSVPHAEVPVYIAAADLCLAPYDPTQTPGGQIGSGALKVREYLMAGRPVVVAPRDLLPGLIRHGMNGYTLDNDVITWIRFFQRTLPSRAELRAMGAGAVAATAAFDRWDDTARAYHALCHRVAKPPSRDIPAISSEHILAPADLAH